MAPRAPSTRLPWTACTPGAAADDEEEEAAEPVDDAVESAEPLEPAVELAVEVALPEALRVVLLTRTTPVPVGYEVELPAGKKAVGTFVGVAMVVVLEVVGTTEELA